MRLAVSKGLGKICMVVIMCLIFVLPAVSCRQNEADDPMIDSSDGISLPTVAKRYSKLQNPLSRTAFLKLEIEKIYEDVFFEEYVNGRSYIMLECRVMADFYESGINANEKIILPIMLNARLEENDVSYSGVIDINKLKLWLNTFDYIYVYTMISIDSFSVYVASSNNDIKLESDLQFCNLTLYSVLPSADDKVRIELLDDFFAENHVRILHRSEIKGMDNFCYDGISCEDFESNVTELSNYIDNEQAKEKETQYEKKWNEISGWFAKLYDAFIAIFTNNIC